MKFKSEVQKATEDEQKNQNLSHGGQIIIVVNLDEDLLHRASFKLDMIQKLANLEQNADDTLEKAYAEGKVLLYPYLGNG